jgi:hypothetical protein
MSETLDNNTRSIPAKQEALPGAGGVLALGILSIVFAGLIGLILGIIGMNNAKRAIGMYEAEPDRFSESSYSQVKGGRVCAIIGTSLSAFGLLIAVVVIAIGIAAS